MINDYTERHYPFEGCFNFRDIGGYHNKNGKRIKKGLYFRAGRQDRMTPKDLAQLSELKISLHLLFIECFLGIEHSTTTIICNFDHWSW